MDDTTIIGIIIAYTVVSLVFGGICRAISSNRGMSGGFWWGFFLWVIGIIIVAVRPNEQRSSSSNRYTSPSSELIRVLYCENCDTTYIGPSGVCPECRRPLMITPIRPADWQSYSPAKREELKASFSGKKTAAAFREGAVDAPSFSAADEIEKFKALLDKGIITQEEFDAKKKQFLGL